MKHLDLVDRLRGIYIQDVHRDGCGDLNGSRYHVRHAKDMNPDWFQLPIQEEAAKEIERLRALVDEFELERSVRFFNGECEKYGI